MNKDLTVGKPGVVLRDFCVPLLGSIIFQQLYNIADSLVAGKFIGENALAAVGNSYEITLIFIAFAFGCNMGCSVVVSQLYGAKDYKGVKTAVYTASIFSALICGGLMVLGVTSAGWLLGLIRTPQEVFGDSRLYLDIYVYGLPFVFFYNIATGIFSAMGDSKTPFYFLAVSSVSNIAVDILFVSVFHMGVAGVAWATFLCQGISCVLAVLVVIRRLEKVCAGEKAPVFSAALLRKIVVIAIPSILQQSFISVGNIIIQGVINGFGPAVMAGYSAAVKLNNLVLTCFTTVGNGVSNYTAQNIGAGKLPSGPAGLPGGHPHHLAGSHPSEPAVFLRRQAGAGSVPGRKLCPGHPDGTDFPADIGPLLFCDLRQAHCRRHPPGGRADEEIHGGDLCRSASAGDPGADPVQDRFGGAGDLGLLACWLGRRRADLPQLLPYRSLDHRKGPRCRHGRGGLTESTPLWGAFFIPGWMAPSVGGFLFTVRTHKSVQNSCYMLTAFLLA